MTRKLHPGILVALCGILVGYALLDGGGRDSNNWLVAGAIYVPLAAISLSRGTRSKKRLFAPLLILPACIAIQLLPWPAPSVAPALTSLELLRVLVYLAVFLTMRETAARHPGSEWLLLVIPLALGCVEAAMGILQHLRDANTYAAGTFAYHSHFAGFMAVLLPVAIAFAISQRQVLGYSVPLVVFVALLHSLSRMGLVASATSVLAMASMRTRRLRTAAAVTAIFVAAIMLMAPGGLASRFQRLATYDIFRKEAQLVVWHDTLQMIAARPVFGSGAGTYEVAFAPYNSAPRPWPVYHADNDYLEFLAEIGLAGTIAAFALLGTGLYRCVQAARGNLAALGCTGSMIALLAHSIFEFQMHIPANVLALCWVAGVGCGVRRQIVRGNA